MEKQNPLQRKDEERTSRGVRMRDGEGKGEGRSICKGGIWRGDLKFFGVLVLMPRGRRIPFSKSEFSTETWFWSWRATREIRN